MTLDKSPINVLLIALVIILVMLFFVVPPMTGIPLTTGSSSVPIMIYEDDSLLAVNATIVEVVNNHAWERHGTQVNAAFKCLNDNGSAKAFKTFGMRDGNGNPIPTNLWLCKDGDDWYAIITTTLEKVGGNRIGRLVTAYLVDKTKFATIDAFITAITNEWRAIPISFIIEAGSVFLQPK
jgi:hypothetical protein